MDWLLNNLATIIISVILALVVFLIIFKMIRDRKKGKSSCGCDCSCCSMGGCCHSNSGNDTDKKTKNNI